MVGRFHSLIFTSPRVKYTNHGGTRRGLSSSQIFFLGIGLFWLSLRYSRHRILDGLAWTNRYNGRLAEKIGDLERRMQSRITGASIGALLCIKKRDLKKLQPMFESISYRRAKIEKGQASRSSNTNSYINSLQTNARASYDTNQKKEENNHRSRR